MPHLPADRDFHRKDIFQNLIEWINILG